MDEAKAFRLIRELRARLHLREHEGKSFQTRKDVDKLVDEAEAFLKANGESDWAYDDEQAPKG
jgi:hypothetical protein